MPNVKGFYIYTLVLFQKQAEADLKKCHNNAKQNIISGANIIACTLSSCYNRQMEIYCKENPEFEISTCIVDGATQSCEAETLIPLMLKVKNLILVGDPTNQLPANVMSTVSIYILR